ncbi:hypothetical protein EVJ58_g7894 [Rhodofomes roseus]|uniref:Uncharacterized protein n=1 Tax=Rhodofomes roseus TaxID=34475 RepID=A0A4Y9Y2N0_9APHY|nr:hypothetical protein EVJ58_g7894 [Rhodofomes roseus]
MCSNTVLKSTARVITVMSQKQCQNLREFYNDKKYKPLKLRPQKTRAGDPAEIHSSREEAKDTQAAVEETSTSRCGRYPVKAA